MVTTRCLVLPLALLVCGFGSALIAHSAPQMSKNDLAQTMQRFRLGAKEKLKAQASAQNNSQDGSLTEEKYYDADHMPKDKLERDVLTIEDHPHGFWKIEKSGDFDMEVDDSTGQVLSYGDAVASEAGRFQTAGDAISREKATTLAEKAIRATGASLDNFAMPSVGEYQDYGTPSASGHRLRFNWLRTFHGIPFRRYGARVCLGAETGQVIWLVVDDQLVDPETLNEKVTREQALTISAAQLSAVGVTDVPVLSVQKQIVPINRYWEAGDTTRISRQTRAVWNCTWGYPEKSLEVWVDTETGDVVGGQHEGSLGGHRTLPKPKFGHQLKRAEVPLKVKATK